jgi:hypothetical protein
MTNTKRQAQKLVKKKKKHVREIEKYRKNK